MCFLKKVNFKRSYAFAQIALFYALPMLKKQNLTHPKAAKLATLRYYIMKCPLLRIFAENMVYFTEFLPCKKFTFKNFNSLKMSTFLDFLS